MIAISVHVLTSESIEGWIFGHSILLPSFYNTDMVVHEVLAQNGYNLQRYQDDFCLLYFNNFSLLLI